MIALGLLLQATMAGAQAPRFLTAAARQPVEGAFLPVVKAEVWLEKPEAAPAGEWPLLLGRSGGPTSPAWPTVPGVDPTLSEFASQVPQRLRELREACAAQGRSLPPTLKVRFEHDGYQSTSVDVPTSLFGSGQPLWPPDGGVVKMPLDTATITFVTEPAGAEVRLANLDGLFLGRAGTPNVLLLPMFLGSEGRFIDRPLYFLLDGYAPRQEIVNPKTLKRASFSVWPTSGAVLLAPASRWVALRDGVRRYAWLIGVAVAAAIAVGLTLRRRTARERALLAEAERLRESPPQAAPQRLGRWELGPKIGQGGSATVYRAVDAESPNGEAVAVKILDEDAAEEEAERKRFEREVGISCRLSHPSIVRIIDWDADRDQPYLVMELLEGEPLRRKASAGPMSPDDFRRIFHALLDAMRYAHDQGVVHRDLKPENVILTRRGVPKIVDFGIARGTLFATVTTTGRTVGTFAYLPPERFVAAITDDPRSDQYALGVMGYELLAGRRPWPDSLLGDVMLGIVQTRPDDLRTLRPDVPSAVVDCIEQMMRLVHEERYPGLREALQAFDAAWEDRPR